MTQSPCRHELLFRKIEWDNQRTFTLIEYNDATAIFVLLKNKLSTKKSDRLRNDALCLYISRVINNIVIMQNI